MSATDFLDAYLNQHCKASLSTRQKGTRSRVQSSLHPKATDGSNRKPNSIAVSQSQDVLAKQGTGIVTQSLQQHKAKRVGHSANTGGKLYIAELYDLSNGQHQHSTSHPRQKAAVADASAPTQRRSTGAVKQKHNGNCSCCTMSACQMVCLEQRTVPHTFTQLCNAYTHMTSVHIR